MTTDSNLVDFTFASAWQHAGKDYKAGDTIAMRKDIAEKLTALKAGNAAAAPKSSPKVRGE